MHFLVRHVSPPARVHVAHGLLDIIEPTVAVDVVLLGDCREAAPHRSGLFLAHGIALLVLLKTLNEDIIAYCDFYTWADCIWWREIFCDLIERSCTVVRQQLEAITIKMLFYCIISRVLYSYFFDHERGHIVSASHWLPLSDSFSVSLTEKDTLRGTWTEGNESRSRCRIKKACAHIPLVPSSVRSRRNPEKNMRTILCMITLIIFSCDTSNDLQKWSLYYSTYSSRIGWLHCFLSYDTSTYNLVGSVYLDVSGDGSFLLTKTRTLFLFHVLVYLSCFMWVSYETLPNFSRELHENLDSK